MKALVGVFNQEKALVGAFSVIVKTDCETDGALHSSSINVYKCAPPLTRLPRPLLRAAPGLAAAECGGRGAAAGRPRPLHHRRGGCLLRHHQALVALPPRGREQQPPDSLGTQLSSTRGLVECGQVIIRKFNLFYFTF